MNLYKWLYTYLTPWLKRPWTYVRRDFYHALPLINIGFFFWVGLSCGLYYPRIVEWIVAAPWNPLIFTAIVWFIGALQSHFFWTTKWIKGQKGDE